jgi:hypothetical protein
VNVRYPNLTEYLAVAASVVSSRSRNCVKEVPELFRQVPAELLQELVGRPGLDPGTLGFEPERTEASVVIRVAWSGDYASPLTSADVLSNLLPWLHDWLHRLGAGASGAVQVSGSDGLKIEVRVER